MTTRSTFSVPKMDCPSEERLIRMALDSHDAVLAIECDLERRLVHIVHGLKPQSVLDALSPLGLGARLLETQPHTGEIVDDEAAIGSEAPVLRILLAINAAMFVAEVGVGWFAQSTGLMADGLDMLADAWVYGLALYAVGRSKGLQRRAARLSGYAQILLAAMASFEVIRRTMVGSEPYSLAMIGTAIVALVANLACIALLHRHRKGGLHMRASWIFSTNDAIANLGVIVAGGLIYVFGSPWPDLVIGMLIAIVVFRGGMRILRMSSAA